MTTLTVSSVGRHALPRERPPHSNFASPHWDSRSLRSSQLPSRSRFRTD